MCLFVCIHVGPRNLTVGSWDLKIRWKLNNGQSYTITCYVEVSSSGQTKIQHPDYWPPIYLSIYLWINNTSFDKFIIGGLLSSNMLSRRKRRKLKAKPINKEKLKKILVHLLNSALPCSHLTCPAIPQEKVLEMSGQFNTMKFPS